MTGVLLMFVARRDDRVTRRASARATCSGHRPPASAAPPGKLARQNAVRNPSRTASTAAAVMIGLALITFVAVIGQGFKTSFTSAVDDAVRRPTTRVSAGNDGELLTNKAAQAVAKAPGVKAVSEIRSGKAKVGGKTVLVTRRRREPDEGRSTSTWASGSDAAPAQLGRDGAFVAEAVRRRPLAEARLAADREDADRARPLRLARERHRRPAQGRLAVRRGLGLHGDVRQLVRRPRQRADPAEHRWRPVRGEHRSRSSRASPRSRPPSSRPATSSRRHANRRPRRRR